MADPPTTQTPEAAAPAAGTRERILEAASSLFLERGYEATSLNDLAKSVGISAPALYWHFDSKEEILVTFMERALTRFAEGVLAAVTAEEPTEQLRQLVFEYVSNQLEQREYQASYDRLYGYGQLLPALSTRNRERIVAVQRRFVDRVREILAEGKETGEFVIADITVTAFAIITLCEYSFTWFKPGRALDAAAVARQYSDLVERMVSQRVGR